MINQFNIPNEIYKKIENLSYKIDNIGRSGDTIIIFEKKYILKISSNKEKLKREKDKNDWLINYLPVNKSICYYENDTTAYYLKSYIDGDSLINEKFINNPKTLIDLLAQAIKLLAQVDISNCPFKSMDNIGNNFVHGDLCLPNILIKDGKVVGFIDLENSGKGDVWYDYSWALWSLSYNLETNLYNNDFLNKINVKFNEEKFNQYIPKEYRKDFHI